MRLVRGIWVDNAVDDIGTPEIQGFSKHRAPGPDELAEEKPAQSTLEGIEWPRAVTGNSGRFIGERLRPGEGSTCRTVSTGDICWP